MPTLIILPTEKLIYYLIVCITNMKEDLLNNIKTLLNSANLVYNSKDYTSATILYFKLLFTLLDYLILIRKGLTPKDHTERFKILKDWFKDEYLFLDKYFDVYRDTYSIMIEKEKCDKVKEHVKGIIEKYKIFV